MMLYPPLGPNAVPEPTPEEEAQLAQQAAYQGRQTRDIPLWAGRRLWGSLGLYGFYHDLRRDEIGLDTYDQMRRDDTVSAALTLLKAPILGRIRQATVNCDDPRIKRVIEHVFIESGLLQRLAVTSFRALDFGAAFHEIGWKVEPLDLTYTATDETGQDTEQPAFDGPGLWPEAFYEVNPETVREIRRAQPGYVYNGFIQRGYPEVAVEAVNSFVYTWDGEFGNMWGRAKTKYAYPYWMWKQSVLKSWMMWLEGKADPPRKAFYPKGTDEQGLDNGERALQSGMALSNSTVVALPSEALSDTGTGSLRTWDIEELTTTDRTDVFESTANFFNSCMLKAMFVPERAFGVVRETGTYSETKEHVDTFLLTQDFLQADFIENVNDDAVSRVVELNFGPGAARATIELPGITDEERDFVRDIFTKLVTAPDPTLGGVLDMRELAEDQGLPTTEPEQPGAGVYVPPSGEPAGMAPDAVGDAGLVPQLSGVV